MQSTEIPLASSARAKRISHGDTVEVIRCCGQGAYPGHYRIPGEDFGQPELSLACDKPQCVQWPSIQRIGSDGEPLKEWAFHVCECHMVKDQNQFTEAK